jgi:hypothetical protein
LKDILSNKISGEQLGFLQGRQFHQVIGMAQEGLYSIHTRKQREIIYQVDLVKASDYVSWLYIRILLIHPGFFHSFVIWILNCISTKSFAILINGSAAPFFEVERGLKQGCSLSPLLFFLVVKRLSGLITNAVSQGLFKGI